jgi:Ricin-type beta-trefoil lectin domain
VYDARGKTAAGNPVEIATCVMNPPQNWTIESGDTIRTKGRRLDTSNPGAGSVTILSTCNGAASGVRTPEAGYSPADQASGPCLTDPDFNTVNGTQLRVQDSTGAKDQQWHVPAV